MVSSKCESFCRHLNFHQLALIFVALSLGACGSKDNGGSAKTDDGSAKKEASGGETYNWQIGNVLSADQPWDLGLNKFAELLSEYSDGRITATVQSGGTLGLFTSLFSKFLYYVVYFSIFIY